MKNRTCFALAIIFAAVPAHRAIACCPAPPPGMPVVNADQTVVLIWDAATHTEHFIRRASFKSAAADFGFLIPTPTKPTLEESGNEAFAFLQKLTAPETKNVARPSNGMGCGCSKAEPAGDVMVQVQSIKVLEEKTVAGFNAVVLETDSTAALADWLKAHDYAYSAEVQAWAKPYVDLHWKITALKVAKDDSQAADAAVTASALRLSFQTDRPLFPYREPDSAVPAKELAVKDRLLRIYFIGESRYQGELAPAGWTGRPVWADQVRAYDRSKLLKFLKLDDAAAPSKCWLTEFEDHWPYSTARSDLYFSPNADQNTLKRPPILHYVSTAPAGDVAFYALAFAAAMPVLLRRGRK